MYSLVRRYVETAIAFLVVGLALGAWMIARAATIVRGAPLWLRLGIVVAGIAQGVGIGMFFSTIWSRIRPVGSQTREARGERF